MTLSDLLGRVEGAGREIDAALYDALVREDGRIAFKVKDWSRPPGNRLSRYHDGWLAGKSADDEYADDLPRYTDSMDAALALVERKLPRTWWLILDDATDRLWNSTHREDGLAMLPNFIIRGLLRALIQLETQGTTP